MKFPILEKIANLMKDLKCEHQSIFPLWGRLKLNFRDSTENQILFLKTLATVKFFHQIVKKWHFGTKKKIIIHQMDLYNPYMVPHTIP